MDAQLKGLLGKVKRPVIVNGRLLMEGRHMIVAGLNNYHAEFMEYGTDTFLSEEWGYRKIDQALAEFDKQYVTSGWKQAERVDSYVDTYSGAVVIETPLYQTLSSIDTHAVSVQYNAADKAKVLEFASDHISNYYDIYLYLYNRRIAAQHMSIMARSHFVAGFYQPLVVESQGITSPLGYGENSWFHAMLGNGEKYLEHATDSIRKLNLSCIAMCDIAGVFGVAPIQEFDRKRWMLLCCLVMLSQLDPAKAKALSQKYGRMTQAIFDTQAEINLWSAMMQKATKVRTSIGVVR